MSECNTWTKTLWAPQVKQLAIFQINRCMLELLEFWVCLFEIGWETFSHVTQSASIFAFCFIADYIPNWNITLFLVRLKSVIKVHICLGSSRSLWCTYSSIYKDASKTSTWSDVALRCNHTLKVCAHYCVSPIWGEVSNTIHRQQKMYISIFSDYLGSQILGSSSGVL